MRSHTSVKYRPARLEFKRVHDQVSRFRRFSQVVCGNGFKQRYNHAMLADRDWIMPYPFMVNSMPRRSGDRGADRRLR
jgi:hypothetical protein